MSFEQCKQAVNDICSDIRSLTRQLALKQSLLREARERLQQTCNHTFIRESDGDYHKPRFYYICSECQYTVDKLP